MLQHFHPINLDSHATAQAELNAYLEQLAQAIAPEPDVQFID